MSAVSVIGLISVTINYTGYAWQMALFVIFVLFLVDGIATIVADCRRWDDERFKKPDFLEDVDDEK